MGTAVHAEPTFDITDTPHCLRKALVLGIITCIWVLAMSFALRFLDGAAELVVAGAIGAIGLGAHIILPAIWTQPRTVEGISGASGIALGATGVYLLVDVILLQNIGTYTNRWAEIGGGSNWWYHPTWWMVGTYLSWLGAFIWANQEARGGASVAKVLSLVVGLTVVVGAAAVLLHFPGAGWGLGTFAVATLPALALGTWVSSFGPKRA